MTARCPGWRRNRSALARRGFPPAPLPGPHPRAPGAPPARGRCGPVLAATGIGGAALLGMSLSAKPGSPQFYLLTAGLAGTWATGALSTGLPPLRRPGGRRDAFLVAGSVLTGAAAFGLFYGATRLARHIPPLNRAIGTVLGYADCGSMPLVLLTASANAVAEELFFHGALWPATQQSHPSPLQPSPTPPPPPPPATPLVLVGIATSVLFGFQRHTSGGILAPALSHVTWSLLMLTYLPPLYRTPPADRAHPRLTGAWLSESGQPG